MSRADFYIDATQEILGKLSLPQHTHGVGVLAGADPEQGSAAAVSPTPPIVREKRLGTILSEHGVTSAADQERGISAADTRRYKLRSSYVEYNLLTLAEVLDMDSAEIGYVEELGIGDKLEFCIRHIESEEEKWGREMVEIRRVA